MKFLLASLGVIIATPSAFADLHMGTYTGTDQATGAACSFTVKSKVYLDNLRHPLNERVEVEANGHALTLLHPPIVDPQAGTVLFNHDLLSGAKGIAQGGVAAIIRMEHSETMDGPVEFNLIRHDYKNPSQNTQQVCTGLIPPQH